MNFVREAFIQFGREHWGLAQLDSKLIGHGSGHMPGRFRSLNETATALGVQRSTVLALLSRAPGAAQIVPVNGVHRYVVDMEALSLPPKIAGQSLGPRKAARRLGIPVSVLHGLRQSGHLERKHLGSRLASFHEADLDAFNAKVGALSIGPFQKVVDEIRLDDIMRMKFKSDDGKAQLVRSVLDGELRVVGSTGAFLGDLLLCRQAVTAHIEKARATAFGNALAPKEVSARLECDPMVVPKLVEMELLEGQSAPAGLRITIDSVETFLRQYRSVASLAKERRTSSRKLARELEAQGIALLIVERGSGKAVQPFIPLASTATVSKLNARRSPEVSECSHLIRA